MSKRGQMPEHIGLCVECRKKPRRAGYIYCEECYQKSNRPMEGKEMKEFEDGDQVWRVQGDVWIEDGPYVIGPATVSAIIIRSGRTTYLLTWDVGPEVTDEQSPEHLFPTEKEAQAEANRRWNAHLDTLRR